MSEEEVRCVAVTALHEFPHLSLLQRLQLIAGLLEKASATAEGRELRQAFISNDVARRAAAEELSADFDATERTVRSVAVDAVAAMAASQNYVTARCGEFASRRRALLLRLSEVAGPVRFASVGDVLIREALLQRAG